MGTHRRAIGVLAWCLGLAPGLAQAELFVCGDALGVTQVFYRDPSAPRPGNCTQIAKAETAPQVALIQASGALAQTDHVGRFDYLKVVAGLAVEKSQAEKEAVMGQRASLAAAHALLVQEVTTDSLCAETSLAGLNQQLATAKATVQAAIDGMVNVSTAKAAVQALTDTQFTITRRLVRCMVALRRLGNG